MKVLSKDYRHVVLGLKGEVLKRLSKTLRYKARVAVKRAYARMYINELGDVMEEEPELGMLEDLLEGCAFRVGINGSVRETPYGSSAFRELCALAFEDQRPSGWTPDTPLDWLGPGELAFVDSLTEWFLGGKEAIPKDGEPEFERWESLYAGNLEELLEKQRPETEEVVVQYFKAA